MKELHPYNWLAQRMKKIHPFVEVYNNNPGGHLVFCIGWREMGGAGRIFTEDKFLEAVRYARKNQPPIVIETI